MKTTRIYRNITKWARKIAKAKEEAKTIISDIANERGVLDALQVEAEAILKL